MLYLLDTHIIMELGFCVFFILAAIYFYLGLQRSLELARKAKIKLLGEEALATILVIEKDGDGETLRPFKIQIQVEPVRGRNFVTLLTDVPRAHADLVKVGAKLRVKYRAKNRKEVVFLSFLPEN